MFRIFRMGTVRTNRKYLSRAKDTAWRVGMEVRGLPQGNFENCSKIYAF